MEQRENSGILFKNDRKTDPKHPDYKGEMAVSGQKFWLSAWIKEGKFMSLAATPKQESDEPPRQRSEPPANREPVPESDIPFARGPG